MDMRSAPGFDLPRYLAVLPLFSDVDAAGLQRLAASSMLRRMTRGDMVLRAGQVCDAFHVMVVGQVKLFAVSPAGQEKVVEIIGPGGSFGEALMFLGRPCIVNAQVLGDALVLSVSRAGVLAELESDPAFALRMLAGLSRRLHGMVKDVQSYALQSGL